MEKLVILGTGIAGLTAAIYAARANLSPLVIGGPQEGGQITLTTHVENFPGFENGLDGTELVTIARKQAERFGTRYKSGIAVKYEHKKDHHIIHLDSGEKIESKTLIIATGAMARWLDIPSQETYRGKGVSACATCDGFFFKGKEVIVIGGGDTAMEESLYLSKFCTNVTIVHRRDEFRASKIMQAQAKKNPKIHFLMSKTVEEILGDGIEVKSVRLKDTKTGKPSEFKTDGVFLAIGHDPNTAIFKGILEMDQAGYLVTDRNMKTKIPGLFAAGDVQDSRYRQAVTAAGTGCQAALEAEKYLESLK